MCCLRTRCCTRSPNFGSTVVHMRGVQNQIHLARLAEMSYVNFSTLKYIVFFRKRSDFFPQLYEKNGDVILITEDLLNQRNIWH